MKIQEAIAIISRYIDMINLMNVLSSKELEELMEAESAIYKYIKENKLN